ncbi:MAG: DUF1223 domain-containing protein [Ferruginibacter sp.]
MKKSGLAIILLVSVAIMSYGFVAINKTNPADVQADGFAIVELFTSEGCSSCPAADKVIADLLARNIDNVFILSYHVDYWDRLGWKDAFSKSEFSSRQRQYAAQFASESIYTPQVIVNGSVGFVGSDETRVIKTVSDKLKSGIGSDIIIHIVKDQHTVTVYYDINEKEPVLLNIALVQPKATTNVKRGENGGRKLSHVNIVREFKTLEAKGKGTASIEITGALSGEPLEILAFTQEKTDLKVLGADKSLLNK